MTFKNLAALFTAASLCGCLTGCDSGNSSSDSYVSSVNETQTSTSELSSAYEQKLFGQDIIKVNITTDKEN